MRSQTGTTLSLSKGLVYSTSTRQKLNTLSSTESELVAMADILPKTLWIRYFLETQGYIPKDYIIYQDNKSEMSLEQNGRRSMGKRARHINIRHFCMMDKCNSKEISIEHCNTNAM